MNAPDKSCAVAHYTAMAEQAQAMGGGRTPGPWFTFANGQCIGGPVGPLGNPSGADTAGIAHCGMGLRTGAEIQANARLMAAAPDLLAFAQGFMELEQLISREDMLAGLAVLVDQANAAIARSTGAAS